MQKMLTGREKAIAYITAGVILSGLLFNFLIGPMLSKNESLNAEIKVSRAKLIKYMELLSRKDILESKYGKPPASGNEKGGGFLVGALTELEGLAKAAGVRIIDIRPQNTEGAGSYKEAMIDLRTEASMDAYLKFIYDIESSLLLLRIKRMQINTRSNSPALEGSFSISQLIVEE